MKIRHAIFDFDGTLVDSLGWFASVINDVAARHGFRQVSEAQGQAMRDMEPRAILKELGIPLWKVPSIARDVRALKLQAAGGLSLFPGARQLLEGLDAGGIVLSIVSSDSEESVRRSLTPPTAALIRHFACSASLFGKARRIRRVAAKSGIAGDATIYIGDEIRDASAARAAGVRFGAVAWGYATPCSLEAACPDVLFRGMDDIASIAG